MVYEKIGKDPNVVLRGNVVWITGASSGIGEYLAYELAKRGCKLLLSARRKAELEKVKENCAGKVKEVEEIVLSSSNLVDSTLEIRISYNTITYN